MSKVPFFDIFWTNKEHNIEPKVLLSNGGRQYSRVVFSFSRRAIAFESSIKGETVYMLRTVSL